MKLVGDALISLPFTLDFCSQGPDVEPLTCRLSETDVMLIFPPSLSEGTDGQGIIAGWAWWTGRSLRLVLEREVDSVDDVPALRAALLATGNEVLRRFLNAYRWRFHAPAVHPVRIDPRVLTLQAVHADGTSEPLEEPFASFFYRSLPPEPPLSTSVNATTVAQLQADVQDSTEPPMDDQLELDAEALEVWGESERANRLREVRNRG